MQIFNCSCADSLNAIYSQLRRHAGYIQRVFACHVCGAGMIIVHSGFGIIADCTFYRIERLAVSENGNSEMQANASRI